MRMRQIRMNALSPEWCMLMFDTAARQIHGNIIRYEAQMIPACRCCLRSTSCVEGCNVAEALTPPLEASSSCWCAISPVK